MPTLRIPTPLRPYTGGLAEVTVSGSTVAEAVDDLVRRYPPVRPHLFDDKGDLRPFVNLFLGEENVNDLQGGQTPLQESDRILLVPSVAGGRRK